jgi:hypothetical protein
MPSYEGLGGSALKGLARHPSDPAALADGAAHTGAWGPRTVLGAMALYLAAFAVMRLSLTTSLSIDDAEQMVFAQRLAWGYALDQPPLYTWMLMGVQLVFGAVPAASIALNYSLFLVAAALFFLCAHRILGDQEHAALATLALLSMNTIGWNMHQFFTHTMLLMASCAAGLWAFLAVVDRGWLRDYLLFGVALGLGVLSKYSFAAFVVCLLLAAALQPAVRGRVLRWEMLLSLGVALALVSPHLRWLCPEGQCRGAVMVYRGIAGPSPHQGWGVRVLGGLGSIPASVVGFLSPLLIATSVLIPGVLKPRPAALAAADRPGAPDLVRLIRDMLLMGLLLLLLGALAGAVASYRERWLYPLLLFAPIYLMARIRWAPPPARRWRLFIAALVLYPLAVFATRGAQLILGPPLCAPPCSDRIPFDQLADRLAASGFSRGTIIGSDLNIAGNLRTRFPASRVVSLAKSLPEPPRHGEAGQCLIVWNADRAGADPPPAALAFAGLTPHQGPTLPAIERLAIPWRLPLRGGQDLITNWAYLLLPKGSGRCA